MATQLRAVVDNRPTYMPVVDTINGLAFARSQIATVLPEADEISLSFGDDYRLMLTIKVAKREHRDLILFRLRNQMITNYEFANIIERVETGARRRLVITAEVL